MRKEETEDRVGVRGSLTGGGASGGGIERVLLPRWDEDCWKLKANDWGLGFWEGIAGKDGSASLDLLEMDGLGMTILEP